MQENMAFKMEEPLISAIIPTYNRADFIAHTIRSVLKQSYRNIEIVVVDDASIDNTDDIVKNITDPRIIYIRHDKNCGPSAARNTGVRIAKGRFVAFLDSDDEWFPQKIESQLAAIKQQAHPDNVVCYTQVIVSTNKRTYLLPTRGKYENEPIGDYVCGDGFISTCSIMLPHDLALNTPFPVNLKHYEDWDFLLRLEEKGVYWLYLDKTLTTWNNLHREDRLSLSPDDGTDWLIEHKKYLTKKAQTAFSIKAIVRPLIQTREKKLYALRILFRGFLANEVSFPKFIKLSLKIIFPPVLLKQLKALVNLHPRQQMDS
jgi:glycosyltransferase involved in cell wall biosynthesis